MLLSSLADISWAPFLLGLLLGLPSAVLYLAEIVVIFRYWHKFDSSFFMLFVIRAIPNLLNLFSSYVGLRFGKLGLFLPLYQQLPRLLLCFFYFSTYYFFHVENLANLFLLLNRLSSIILPLTYNKIWRFLLPIVLPLIFLLPIAITIQIFFVNVFLYMDGDGRRTFTLNYTYFDGFEKWPLIWRKGNNYLAAVSSVAFCLICLAINLGTVILLRQKNNQHQQQSGGYSSSRGKIERRMTLYALISFFGQMLISAYYIFFYWVSSYARHMFSAETTLSLYSLTVNHYPWVNDLATIALPAWLMLWASQRMRRTVLFCFCNAFAFCIPHSLISTTISGGAAGVDGKAPMATSAIGQIQTRHGSILPLNLEAISRRRSGGLFQHIEMSSSRARGKPQQQQQQEQKAIGSAKGPREPPKRAWGPGGQ